MKSTRYSSAAPGLLDERDAAAEDGSMTSEPLATYTEHLLEVRREFALYEDRVVVRARWLPRRRFEHVVKLAGLDAAVQEIVVRYRMYRYAGWILAIGPGAGGVLLRRAEDRLASRGIWPLPSRSPARCSWR